jgi:hypothetical protein
MPFKIQIYENDKQGWIDCWVHPQPQSYKQWIEEFKSQCFDLPNEKFRLIRYVFEVRLESKNVR